MQLLNVCQRDCAILIDAQIKSHGCLIGNAGFELGCDDLITEQRFWDRAVELAMHPASVFEARLAKPLQAVF